MSKARIDDAMLYQVMERAWLIMAFISSALSDHPVVKSNRLYRRLTDRSRKALFDLHNDVEDVLLGEGARNGAPAKQGRPKRAETAEDDFGAKFLQVKGTISPDVPLGFHDDDPPRRGQRRRGRKGRS